VVLLTISPMVWVASLGLTPLNAQLTSSGTQEELGNRHGRVSKQLSRLNQSKFGASHLLLMLKPSSEKLW
jgi:hypothetical protein